MNRIAGRSQRSTIEEQDEAPQSVRYEWSAVISPMIAAFVRHRDAQNCEWWLSAPGVRGWFDVVH